MTAGVSTISLGSQTETDIEERGEPVFKIDPKKIRFNPLNPRKKISKKEIEELADSIDADGQDTPVLVFRIKNDPEGYKYMLMDGQRRLMAILHLIFREGTTKAKGKGQQRTIRAYIEEEKSKRQQLFDMFRLNFLRKGHTPPEIAAAVSQMIKDGYDVPTIAKSVGKPIGWVYQHRRLNDLAPEVLELMGSDIPDKERLKFQVALTLASLPHELQKTIARRIVSQKMSSVEANFYARTEAQKNGFMIGRAQRPDKNRESIVTFVTNTAVALPTFINIAGSQSLEVLIAGLDHDQMKKLFDELVSCQTNISKMLAVVQEVGNRYPKFKGCVPKK